MFSRSLWREAKKTGGDPLEGCFLNWRDIERWHRKKNWFKGDSDVDKLDMDIGQWQWQWHRQLERKLNLTIGLRVRIHFSSGSNCFSQFGSTCESSCIQNCGVTLNLVKNYFVKSLLWLTPRVPISTENWSSASIWNCLFKKIIQVLEIFNKHFVCCYF